MPSIQPPHMLLFEPDPHGHTSEWVEHLCHFAQDERGEWQVTFIVAPELAQRLSQILPTSARSHIHILTLGPRETRLCLHASLPVSGFSRWWFMRHYLKQTGADHGIFLSIDHLSLPLAFGLRMGRRTVSGILFRPSTHYLELTPDIPATLKERIRDFRKRILYGLMLRNNALRKVFSLDPYFPPHAARSHARGDKVKAIEDPAFPLLASESVVADAPTERIVFLLFGALAARKGILILLAALRELEAETVGKIAVIIAGRVDPSIRKAVDAALSEAQRSQPALWLKLDDRRLPMSELANLIHGSDVILAPYQRFVGSSGVLLWAASAGKPVITQNYGLVGKLCEEHKLGLAVDTTDPQILATAIKDMSLRPTTHFSAADAAMFSESHTPRHFAATLFDAVPIISASNAEEISTAFQPHTGHASPFR